MATLSADQFNAITYQIRDAGIATGWAPGYQETVLNSLPEAERSAYESMGRELDANDAAHSDSEGTF